MSSEEWAPIVCAMCGQGMEQVQRLLPMHDKFLCKDCAEAAHDLFEREYHREPISPQIARVVSQAINQQREVAIDLGFRSLRGQIKGLKYQYLYGTLALTWLLFQDDEGSHHQLNASQIRLIEFTGPEPAEAAADEEAMEGPAVGTTMQDTTVAALEQAFARTRDTTLTESLEAYLVRLGLIGEEELGKALQDTRRKEDEPLGRLLVRLGYIRGPQIKKVLELQYGIPYSDVRNIKIPRDVLELLPEEVLRKFQVFPFRNQNGVVSVGMVDPRDTDALDEIRYHLQGMATDIRLISEHDFAFVMETIFPLE